MNEYNEIGKATTKKALEELHKTLEREKSKPSESESDSDSDSDSDYDFENRVDKKISKKNVYNRNYLNQRIVMRT